jgi:hypothetical protein
MIYWRDERADFEAKLAGLLDRGSRLQRIVYRRRVRLARPDVAG